MEISSRLHPDISLDTQSLSALEKQDKAVEAVEFKRVKEVQDILMLIFGNLMLSLGFVRRGDCLLSSLGAEVSEDPGKSGWLERPGGGYNLYRTSCRTLFL